MMAARRIDRINIGPYSIKAADEAWSLNDVVVQKFQAET
jgi:hypothetical protein